MSLWRELVIASLRQNESRGNGSRPSPGRRETNNNKPGRYTMSTPDLVIRGGTVADGNGGELFEADVAITGGRISEVGKVSAKGRQEIDAKGKLVAPGFVDVHTHYDGQVTWSQDITPSSQNGVTPPILRNGAVG